MGIGFNNIYLLDEKAYSADAISTAGEIYDTLQEYGISSICLDGRTITVFATKFKTSDVISRILKRFSHVEYYPKVTKFCNNHGDLEFKIKESPLVQIHERKKQLKEKSSFSQILKPQTTEQAPSVKKLDSSYLINQLRETREQLLRTNELDVRIGRFAMNLICPLHTQNHILTFSSFQRPQFVNKKDELSGIEEKFEQISIENPTDPISPRDECDLESVE